MDWSGRVVLVKPPLARGRSYYLSAPAGLLIVAAALEANGLEPVVLDMALEFAEGTLPAGPGLCDAAARRLAAMDADIYGFSVQCITLPISLDIARRLRGLRPHSRVVFGGHHVTLVRDMLAGRFAFLDEVIGGRMENHLSSSAGEWIMPAYSLSPQWGRYVAASARPVGLVEVARGCTYGCRFCSLPVATGHRAEHKPVEMVLREAAWWVGQGCRDVYLIGDTFTLDSGYLARLLTELVSSRLGLQWGVTTRADLVSAARLEKMRDAGCRAILYGIESADARTRRAVAKKGRPYPDLLEFLNWHIELGIRPSLYFLVNLPCDSAEGLEATLKAASQLSAMWPGVCHFQRYRPIPGTELAQQSSGSLTYDPETAYASPVWQTVGGAPEIWDIVRANPDLCSTFYTPPGPATPNAASALDWVGDRVFATFPLTLAALAEKHGLLGFFDQLGKLGAGRQWLQVTTAELSNWVEDCAARLSDELAGIAQYEYSRAEQARLTHAVVSERLSTNPGLDLQVVRQAASNINAPPEPAITARRRPGRSPRERNTIGG